MIWEGQGNIIDFEAMKEKLKNNPPKADTPKAQRNLLNLESCAIEVNEVLKKYNMQMIAVPRLEIIAQGVFRLLGDLVIKPKG